MTFQLLRGLLRQREITGETISMSISVYLLMGLSRGFLCVLTYDRHPQGFSFAGSTKPPSEHNIFPTLIYFSFTTLSTIGFGDITPVMMQARYAAVAEGITGQFYLAILVARLVAMHMSQSESRAQERQNLGPRARAPSNRDRGRRRQRPAAAGWKQPVASELHEVKSGFRFCVESRPFRALLTLSIMTPIQIENV
jgi:hypothetical protein